MGCVSEVGHLIAHAGRQLEPAAILQLGIEFAFEDVEDMASVAPVISEVAGRCPPPSGPAHRQCSAFARKRARSRLNAPWTAPGDQSVVVKGSSGIFMVPANKCWSAMLPMNARTAKRVLHSGSLAPELAQ